MKGNEGKLQQDKQQQWGVVPVTNHLKANKFANGEHKMIFSSFRFFSRAVLMRSSC